MMIDSREELYGCRI
jgi:hypothetical protein